MHILFNSIHWGEFAHAWLDEGSFYDRWKAILGMQLFRLYPAYVLLFAWTPGLIVNLLI